MQLTYSSRLYPTVEQEAQLNQAMMNASQFYHTCFNNFWFNQGKKRLDLKKKEFCEQFGIGTKQANSLILLAEGAVKMWQESFCYIQKVKEIKLTQLKKRELKLIHLLEKIKENSQNEIIKKFSLHKREKVIKTIKSLKTRLWKNHRQQEKIQAWLNKEKTITFGSKKEQRKLSKNQLSIEEWREKRNNFIYGIGEADVSFGNNIIKLLDETTVQIEIAHLEKIKVKVNLHKKELLLNTKKKTARIIRKKIRGKTKYYVQFSVEREFQPKYVESTENSSPVIGGTDLNQHFVSFYTTSGIWQNFHFLNDKKYSSKQREESLRKVVKKLIKEVDVLRIENLDFTKTKSQSQQAKSIKGKQYNAMLHNLPYGMFKKLVEVEAFKAGVKVEKINPKNSSKKALKLGYDRHLGAAKIIAERNL